MEDKTADLRAQIGVEIYTALEAHGASSELLSIIGSYGDTLDDAEVLSLLKDFNQGRQAILIAVREKMN